MRNGLKALTGLVGILASLPTAYADCSSPVVLDQSFATPSLNLGASINEGFDFAAQTFTAGFSGRLVGISVLVNAFGSSGTLPRISIYKAASGLPTSTLLGSVLWGSPSAALADVIDLTSQSIRVTAGQTYVLAIDYPGPPHGYLQAQGTWAGSTDGGYNGGSVFAGSFYSGDSGPVKWYWESGFFAWDLYFKTYVKAPDFDSLLSDVEGVGPGRSFANKVRLAKTYCESGEDYIPASCATLDAFVRQVKAQTGKKVSVAQATRFVRDTETIKIAIGCN